MSDIIDIIGAMFLRCRGVAIVFSGIQAAGKTTFYNTYFNTTHVHINLDTQRTRNRERALLSRSLENGFSFVADNTNPTRIDRERYIVPAKNAGYKSACFIFPPNLTESAKRNESRGTKSVPYAALVSTANKLEKPCFNEGFDDIFSVHLNNSTFVVERMSK